MKRSIRLALLLALLFPGLVHAQNARDLDAEIKAAEDLLSKHEAGETESDRSIAADVKERLALLKELAATTQRVADLPDQTTLEKRKEEVEEALANLKELPEPEPLEFEKESDQAEYVNSHAAAEAERKVSEEALKNLRTRRERAAEEQKELPTRDAKAKRNREGLTGEDERTKYRIATADLEVEVIEARRSYLTRVAAIQGDLTVLRQQELNLALRRLEREKKILEFARAAVAAVREREAGKANQAKIDLEKEAAEAGKRDDLLTQRVLLLRAQAESARSRTEVVGNEADHHRAEIDSWTENIRRLRAEKAHLERRIGFGDAGVADLLRRAQKRAELEIKELIEDVRPLHDLSVRTTEQELIVVLDRIHHLQGPADSNPEVTVLPEDRREELGPRILEAIDKEGLLPALRAQRLKLEESQTLLGELAATLAEAVHERRLFLEFLRSNLLFSQSDEPISLATLDGALAEIPKLAARFTDPKLRAATSDYVRNITRAAALLLGILLIGSLVVLVPGLVRRRAGLASGPADDTVDPEFMGHGAASLRFLVAALPPAGIFLAYGLLSELELPAPLSEVLPRGFLLIGVLLSIARISRWFLHPAGVGIHIMGIRPENARGIKRTINIGATSALFLALPARLITAMEGTLVHLPRLLDFAWLIMLAGCLFVLTRRRGPVLRQIARSGQFLDRLWLFVGPVLVFVLLAMIVLELAGYKVASETIARGIVRSFVVLIVVVLLYSFLVRLIGKLSKQVRKRLVTDLGYEAARESSDAVTDQLTRLAAILIVGAGSLFLLGSWDEVNVLFDLLEEVKLVDRGLEHPLTLLAVLRAVLAIAVGHFIVANLSAVYEFVVFPLIGSTKRGGQFVLLALSRYAILLIAYGLALLFLGLQMSSVAWLFAAASVGIGFGLQEIIANFISGLILLLERPFQVGDIITVDDTDGVVDSIAIRSTILTNWDRKSVIIPNKDFITKKMINWTRNDDITRRKLEIRVAFGSDLKKVNQVIDDTLTAHPNVLADPPHRIWMSSYEDSGFGILVFFFTHVDNGLTTRAELYGQVHDALVGEGIEVPVQKHRISVIHEPPAAGTADEEE